MNISLIKGLVIGGVFATAGGAVAGYNMMSEPEPTHARVLNVIPATETVSIPREVCENVEVIQQKQPRDQRRLLGTITGAIVGGVLGNQVGGGDGKKVATVAGAAAGAYTGNKLQERTQSKDTVTTTETRCHTEVDTVEKVMGYDVTYAIGSEQGQVRLDHDPGAEIPLDNGELVPLASLPMAD